MLSFNKLSETTKNIIFKKCKTFKELDRIKWLLRLCYCRNNGKINKLKSTVFTSNIWFEIDWCLSIGRKLSLKNGILWLKLNSDNEINNYNYFKNLLIEN
jgi:hypothetical protein